MELGSFLDFVIMDEFPHQLYSKVRYLDEQLDTL